MSGRERRQKMDELDLALVAALQRDGRAPNVELAKLLGVSEKTVRLRISRLITEHGLMVGATLPESTQRSRMVYLLHTEPGRRFQVAESLAARPEVDRVHLTTGSADVLVAASFDDDNAALRFLVQTIENHPGVRSAQSCHVIGEVGGSTPSTGNPDPRVDTEALSALMIGPRRYENLSELTDTICDAAITGLGADRVLVATHNSDGDRPMDIAKKRGLSDGYVNALLQRTDSAVTSGVIKRVWNTRLHVVVADARTDPLLAHLHDLVRMEGYVAMLTLPMLYGDSLVATVSFYFDQPVRLSEEYLATAQGVADNFAVAVARMTGLAPASILSEAAPAAG